MNFIYVVISALIVFGALAIASFLTIWTLIVFAIVVSMVYIYTVCVEYKKRKSWKE